MRAAVIVLAWNGAAHLPRCLGALQAQRDADVDVLVVDNGSIDRSVALVREQFSDFELIENGRNLGFSRGMNIGIRRLQERSEPPDVVVLLNQDTVVAADWLAQILMPFTHDATIGAVGCKIYYPDGRTIQHAGKLIDSGRAMSRHFGYGERDEGQYDEARAFDSVTGAALALRMSALDEVGLLDEGYSPAYFEDDDLCWRLRCAGYLVWYAPQATLRHVESSSISDVVRRSTLMNRNRLRFVVKTFPADQIWTHFWLAERMRMALIPNGGEARTLRRAYFEGHFCIDEWLSARSNYHPMADGEARQLRRLCSDLQREMTACDRARASGMAL